MNPTVPDKSPSSERYANTPLIHVFIPCVTNPRPVQARRRALWTRSWLRLLRCSHPLTPFFLAYRTRASNAKDQVFSAAGVAKETVARQSQATVHDIQGLHASTQQAGSDPSAHPLTKYHSFRIPSI